MATEMSTLQDLLEHEIRDLYYVEKQLVKELPKMAKKASDPTLKAAFEEHARETEEHVRRLEEVFELMELKPRAIKCEAMDGLLKEAKSVIGDAKDPSVRDAALIASAQRVEHYEIAAYGCARSFALRVGNQEAADLLNETIQEEGQADKKLTEIAERQVNEAAAIGDDGSQNGSAARDRRRVPQRA